MALRTASISNCRNQLILFVQPSFIALIIHQQYWATFGLGLCFLGFSVPFDRYAWANIFHFQYYCLKKMLLCSRILHQLIYGFILLFGDSKKWVWNFKTLINSKIREKENWRMLLASHNLLFKCSQPNMSIFC